jgi:hypothetical protein
MAMKTQSLAMWVLVVVLVVLKNVAGVVWCLVGS